MRVNEIFKSCQGEGPGVGLPTIFVRLAGCNLALAGTPCVWCFGPTTSVVMADYTAKCVGEVVVGDSVLGVDSVGAYIPTRVTGVMRRTAAVVRINDVLTVTPDHPFYVDRAYRPVGVGDSLVFVGRTTRDVGEFRRGWLAGYILGDGCFHDFLGAPNGKAYLRFKAASKDESLVDNTIAWAREAGFELRKIMHSAGRGAFIPDNVLYAVECTRSKVVEAFRSFLYEQPETPDYARGFLAGAFDAEGNPDWVDGGLRVRISQKDTSPLTVMVFEFASILGFGPKTFVVDGDMTSILIYDATRFYIECTPVLQRKKGFGRSVPTSRQRTLVESVESVGEAEVVNLSTECHTFIAGEHIVHNCDTKYAQPFLGKGMTVGQIVEDVEDVSRGCKRVCITGGEPLYQITELRDLVDTLASREYFVEVFTNGTLFPPLSFLHLVDSWIVDIKCPSSRVSHKCRTAPWIGALRAQDAVKFVVESELDLEYVDQTMGAYSTRAQVFISPCITSDVLQVEARGWLQRVWEFCVERNYCYGLQIHKVVFGNKRGV